MRTLLKSICVFSIMGICLVFAQTNDWPIVEPVHRVHTFIDPGKDGTDTPFFTLIKKTGGAAVYKLECHNGEYDARSVISFSGDFQCALFALNGDGTRGSWNLLATDEPAEQHSDWLNRGRITSNQLLGDCGAVPEYGSVRHFRLRGMSITFRFTDVKWSAATGSVQSKLEQFRFHISVVPDITAQTATADKVQVSVIPPSCR